MLVHKRYDYDDVDNDDFHVHFTKPVKMKPNRETGKFGMSSRLTHDYIRVTINFKKEESSKTPSKSVSRENFHLFIILRLP